MASEPKLYPDDPIQMQVFCAALTGFIANKDFNGPLVQGSPHAAVEFATSVVMSFYYGKKDNPDA